MSQTNFSRYKYMPDNMREEEFLARFVVRQKIFEEIFNDIKNTNFNVPAQHQIIIGQRGQGKTTLLRRIEIAVRDDAELSKFLLVAKFPEEQHNIRFLSRFWEEIALDLQEDIGDVYSDMEKHSQDDNYELENFSYLEDALKANNKKALVLMDNIDIFLDTIKEQEQQRLREILLTSSSLFIIGGSTQMMEQHFDYGKPFYQFFKITTLQGLNREEIVDLLIAVAREDEKAKIQSVIKNTPEKIEALRQLTNGIPRFAILLFDILIDEHDSAFTQMEKLLDEITPFYQDRLSHLPATLKDITHAIAMNWDGIETSEIAKKARLTSKEASSQLQQLKKYHFIESISIGKNNIYKIKERFFNIWYLMRYGRRKDIQRVEWLVRFLTAWYSKDELQEKSKKFITILKTIEVCDSYAYYMGEALRYSVTDIKSEYELKKNMETYLKEKKSSLINDISPSCAETLKQAIQLCKERNVDKAIILLEKSCKKTSLEYTMLGHLYSEQKNYDKAEEYYLKAIESGDNDALNSLSWFYFEQAIKPNEALDFIQKDYMHEKTYYNTHTLAIVLLWQEEFSKSYEKFLEWLKFDNALESDNDLILYLNLLLSKKQLYKAKEFMEMEEYQLKDRYKPIWYALMSLMEKEFPNEIKKMGSELVESVDDILREVESLKTKYSL